MGYYFDAIQRATGRVPVKTKAVSDETTDAVAKTRTTSITLPAPAPTVTRIAGKSTREKRKCEFDPSKNDVIVTARSNLERCDVLAVEKFRDLRVRLTEIGRTRSLRTIVITSASPGEGKTVISGKSGICIESTKG